MTILSSLDMNAQEVQPGYSYTNSSLLAQIRQDAEDSIFDGNNAFTGSSLLEQTRQDAEDSIFDGNNAFTGSSLLEQVRQDAEDSVFDGNNAFTGSSLLEQTRQDAEDSLLNRDGTYASSSTLTDLRENLEEYYQNTVMPNIQATGASAAREYMEITEEYVAGINQRLGYDILDADELFGHAARGFATNSFDDFYASSLPSE